MLQQLVGWAETAAVESLPGDSSSAATVPLETMDEAAFEAFYQRTAPALGAYIRRTCGQPDLADDILQETFLKFLKAPRPAMDEASTRAYLYQTATTLIAACSSPRLFIVPRTPAAPHMSNFISSSFAEGLIEMPPVSNVMPLPQSAIGAVLAGAPR